MDAYRCCSCVVVSNTECLSARDSDARCRDYRIGVERGRRHDTRGNSTSIGWSESCRSTCLPISGFARPSTMLPRQTGSDSLTGSRSRIPEASSCETAFLVGQGCKASACGSDAAAFATDASTGKGDFAFRETVDPASGKAVIKKVTWKDLPPDSTPCVEWVRSTETEAASDTAALAPAQLTLPTSFDCSKAHSDAEHLICTDAELASMYQSKGGCHGPGGLQGANAGAVELPRESLSRSRMSGKVVCRPKNRAPAYCGDRQCGSRIVSVLRRSPGEHRLFGWKSGDSVPDVSQRCCRTSMTISMLSRAVILLIHLTLILLDVLLILTQGPHMSVHRFFCMTPYTEHLEI